MVDINELSSLARKLNQKSDETNSIITTFNKKLGDLNLGLEVWLENSDIEGNEYSRLSQAQNNLRPRQKVVTYLGYCNVEDAWQLATKTGILIEDWDSGCQEVSTELISVTYKPLLKATRQIRVGALPLVPRLLDQIKYRAESLLQAIDEAGKAADKL